jgi:phosphatidylserine/phosphatidylglycerophosphate/cardiolipin synthase-like enzyme
MRAQASEGGLSVRAVAGTHVVLLGIDLSQSAAEGLLGFAIRRTGRGDGHAEWLPNLLRFEANKDAPGAGLSDANPIQAFVWGDYAVAPGSRLTYRVEARYGSPGQLETRAAVELDVDVEPEDDGRHGIWFNRGAAGSQAYAEQFDNVDPRTDPAAQKWLSRGLEEALLATIARATGPHVTLRGAFYEFMQETVLKAFADAVARGADVELVVGRPHDAGGNPIYPADENVAKVQAAGLTPHVTWRTQSAGIPHNKFLVVSEQGQPPLVWSGSTNITDGALWGQSNVGHLVHAPPAQLAEDYLAYWEELARDTPTAALRDFNGVHNPVPQGEPPARSVTAIHSPHAGTDVLKWIAERMAGATQAAFFTAPFGISSLLRDVLSTNHAFPIYALLDKPDKNEMELQRANPENEITSGAFLGKPWHQFALERLTESLDPNVHYIHTKYLLVDPLGDDPLVVTGSANFSNASVETNDENIFVIRGDTRVADIYLSEFMRLFTHLSFRARTADAVAGKAAPTPTQRAPVPDDQVLYLSPDDSWTARWYADGTPQRIERELFRAPAPAPAGGAAHATTPATGAGA